MFSVSIFTSLIFQYDLEKFPILCLYTGTAGGRIIILSTMCAMCNKYTRVTGALKDNIHNNINVWKHHMEYNEWMSTA